MTAESRCKRCERVCACSCGCQAHSHFRHCSACAEDDHRDMLASLVPGDRLRTVGQYMDRIHRAALQRLGRLPLDDLHFRHLVAYRVLTELRAHHRTDLLPGLAA